MFNLHRLFWKTFFAFLLLSIFIMLATSYVVIMTMERNQFREQHQEFVTSTAQNIIDRYEQGLPLNWPRRPHLEKLDRRWRDTFHKEIPLRITHDDELVFQHRGEPRRHAEALEFWLSGASGAQYHITTIQLQAPRKVVATLFRLNALQLVFILLGSILASILLSWSISHPLKQLGLFSRAYANNKSTTPLSPKLLQRRDEIGDLSRDFNFMISEIDKNLRAQKQLLHDVSHELRAPLARLQAAAALVEQTLGEQTVVEQTLGEQTLGEQTLVEGQVDTRQTSNNQHVTRIHRECERMDALIQQILDFSRLEQKLESAELLNVESLLREHINNLCYEHQQRKLVFFNHAEASEIRVSRALLDRAVENVLRNACKYAPESEPIDIGLSCSGNQLCIEIRDRGPGIAGDELEKVLKPFYRAGQQMHTEGFGLGLSIASRAMNLLGGALVLHNHPEGGLLVQLLLPRQQ